MAGPLLGLLPLAGKGLMWGGTALGGAMGATSLMGIPKGVREDILQGGPNDDGKFDTNWVQNLLIDEQSLVPQYNKRQRKEVMNDPTVTSMSMQLGDGFAYQDGWDLKKTVGANAGAYKKSVNEEKRQANLQSYADLYNTPQQIEERRRRDEIRTDELQLRRDDMTNKSRDRQTTLQLGQINARTAQGSQSLQRELGMMQNNTTLQLAQMDSDLADKRMAYDRETRRMDRRDKSIATLMAGIGQLGGAFAL